jgi:hypothetical protein
MKLKFGAMASKRGPSAKSMIALWPLHKLMRSDYCEPLNLGQSQVFT